MYANKHSTSAGGYVALISTIIISAILLVMAVEEGSLGWYSRFNILGTEAKEQANALAEGCADQALAAILTDPTYGSSATTVTTTGGTCTVLPILFNTPSAGYVTIKTQAEVRGSYASLAIALNMSQIHLGTPAPGKGTLVVVTQAINDGSGSSAPSAFTMHVVGTNPSQTVFAGSDTGTVVTMDAGSYTVTEDPKTNYTTTVSSNCAGTIANGQVKFCTVTNDDITTTLALVANVTNDNGGTVQPADILMSIDGTPAALGTRYSVTPGTHSIVATLPSGYVASSWGYNCAGAIGSGTVTLTSGQSKTCTISLDDNAPPAPSCADTVMILDRTGSMSSTDLSNEKSAALALNTLYAGVSSPALPPHLGVGSIGGLDGSASSIPTLGQLSTAYANITSAINSITGSNSSVGSDLSAGITTASTELNGPRHVAGNQKVMILVSDGDPNKPSGTQSANTGYAAPSGNAQNASGDLWSNPTNAYADAGGDASDPVSEDDRHRYSNFGFGSGTGLPTGSTVTGVEVSADAWATTATTIPTPGSSQKAPALSTSPSQWATPNNAFVGDNAYATDATNGHQQGYGNFGFSIPSGATITGIQVTTEAKASGSGSKSLKVEFSSNGGTSWTATKTTTLTSTESVSAPSGNSASDLWGRLWVPSDFNNGNFVLRITNTTSAGTVSLDQALVTVNYTVPTPASVACQLGVDLSWNAGTSWSNEKTQTLTGTEATYTFGASNDDWTSSHTWAPTEFSNTNFRARVHAIDPGSACDNAAVDHLDLLQVKVHYTQPVDPIEAALDAADAAKLAGVDLFTIHFGSDPGPYQGQDLLANLASGAAAVSYNGSTHQNGSAADGSGVTSGSSGPISPTAQAATSGGDGNGFELAPTNAYADGGNYASNIDGAGDRHLYSGYNFVIPPGATITGIQTRLDWWLDSTSGTNSLGVELSWNGGTSWTTAKSDTNESTSASNSRTLGATNDTWGHSWTATELSPANFRVRLTANSTTASRDFYLDWIPVTVSYSVNVENNDGDNFFVAPTSADMQGIFNFIGNQVCPAALVAVSSPPPTTGTLVVMTTVTNNNGGSKVPADFTANISATSPSQTSFPGVSTGVSVTVNPGSYSVSEVAVSGYNEILGATCLGTIAAGETRVCVLSNDDIPPPPPPANFNINVGSWQEVP